MDCPLYISGRRAGILHVAQEGRNTRFTLRSDVKGGLYRVCVKGEKAELLLGAWEGGAMSRLFSRELTAPIGRVLCAEACPVGLRTEPWTAARPGLFPGVQASGALSRGRSGGCELALPFDEDAPFPLPELFCLARVICLNGRRYAVFYFDDRGRPGFPTVF